jgi:hypothetical protein
MAHCLIGSLKNLTLGNRSAAEQDLMDLPPGEIGYPGIPGHRHGTAPTNLLHRAESSITKVQPFRPGISSGCAPDGVPSRQLALPSLSCISAIPGIPCPPPPVVVKILHWPTQSS